MRVVDTHCDLLYKLQDSYGKGRPLDYLVSNELDSNLLRLHRGGVGVQFFAIFVSPSLEVEERWSVAKAQLKLFQEKICQGPKIRKIRRWEDLFFLEDDEIGAVLSLEGIEAIGKDLDRLNYLYTEGLLSVGLTWNKENLAASGALANGLGGLTSFGEKIIELNNQHRVLTDVSHLNEPSFWDVIEKANYVIASHSNCYTLCPHPRNLKDMQIQVLIEKEALISLTFYPPFIHPNSKQSTSFEDLCAHIDYILQLGGEESISFGSDFDGIDQYMSSLRHAGQYQALVDFLCFRYGERLVRKFCYENFEQFILRIVGE